MVLFSLQGCHWSIWRLWLPLVSLITSSHHGGRKHWRFTTTQTAFWRLCVAKPNIHQTRNTKSDIISLGFKPRIFDEQDPPSIPSTPELIPRKFSLSAPVALGKTDRLVRSKSTTITKDHWKFYYSNNCQLKCKNEKWDCTHAPIKSRAIVTPSWFWSEDQLKQPDIKRWKRDYRSFMHSVYLPPCQITKKKRKKKCNGE